MHFRGLHSVTNLFKPQPSPKGSSLRINRAAKCSQNLHIKETILLKTGLLPCPIHPWESQYEESQLCFLLDVQFSLFLTSSHSNIETFILLIQLWAPHCICERARQGAPCKLCTQEQLHPGHKVGKWLQHRLLFPEPPAGSTCSRSSSSDTGCVTDCLTPQSKPIPAEDVWAQHLCQCPTTPSPLKTLRSLEHCGVAQQKSKSVQF